MYFSSGSLIVGKVFRVFSFNCNDFCLACGSFKFLNYFPFHSQRSRAPLSSFNSTLQFYGSTVSPCDLWFISISSETILSNNLVKLFREVILWNVVNKRENSCWHYVTYRKLSKKSCRVWDQFTRRHRKCQNTLTGTISLMGSRKFKYKRYMSNNEIPQYIKSFSSTEVRKYNSAVFHTIETARAESRNH